MKKLSSALLAAGILAGSVIVTAGPAHAGSDKIAICHATSAANGHYNLIEISKDGVANGHAGADHQDGRDIIPAYSWVEDGVRHYFEGQNLDKVGLIATGCAEPKQAEPIVAEINPPTYIPAACARPEFPYGQVVVPAADGEGVVGHTEPVLSADKTQWSTQYTLAADTAEYDWSWPAGQTGLFTFDVVPLTADPQYVVDSKTGVGGCELANTGAGDLLPLVGAAAVIGAAGVYLRRRFA